MKKMFINFFVFAALLMSCTKKVTSTYPTFSYQGSGSEWDWSLNKDGSFSAKELTTNVSIYGTYERLESGFVKMTVEAASGPEAPKQGDEAYALEVPGVALLVKPVLSFEDEIITLVASGTCPDQDFTGNWIFTQYNPNINLNRNDHDAFGTFQWNNDESYGILPSKYSLAGYTHLGANLSPMSGICDKGVITIQDREDAVKMYLTAMGGALVKMEDSGEGVLAMPAQKIESQKLFAGKYAGLLFNDSITERTQKIVVLEAEINAEGSSVTVKSLSNLSPIEYDNKILGKSSIDEINSPSNGFIKVTITGQDGKTGKAACMAGINVKETGKNVVFCIGQAPGENSKAFNLLLVSK